MKIGEIWQKLKDLYGWDKSQLYYMKDKREFNKAMMEVFREKMDKSNDMKKFNKAKYMYGQYESEFDRANTYVENNEAELGEDDFRRSWK